MVWIPGVTSDKINHAYAYGGPNLLQNHNRVFIRYIN